MRAERGVLITETDGGWVCANAGIDSSNLEEGLVSLLPEDGDASARRIRGEIREASGASPAVVIADSFGRPWRVGQADVAIGCAGLAAARGLARQARPARARALGDGDRRRRRARLRRRPQSATRTQACPARSSAGLGDLVIAEDGPGAGASPRPAEQDLFR